MISAEKTVEKGDVVLVNGHTTSLRWEHVWTEIKGQKRVSERKAEMQRSREAPPGRGNNWYKEL